MLYRSVVAAVLLVLLGTQASAVVIDLTRMEPAKPFLFFVIDQPGVEVWATFESADGGAYNIFHDPMFKEDSPQGDNIFYLEEFWETDLVTLAVGGEGAEIRWLFTDTPLFTLAEFDARYAQLAAAPIPAALPMLLAALAGLGWLGRTRRTDRGSSTGLLDRSATHDVIGNP